MIIVNLTGLNEQLDCIHNASPCELTKTFPQLGTDRLDGMCLIRWRMKSPLWMPMGMSFINYYQLVCNNLQKKCTTIYLFVYFREELSQLNSNLRNACDTCYKLYLDNISTIKRDSRFFEGTSLHPPPVSIIEWLDDINIHFANR